MVDVARPGERIPIASDHAAVELKAELDTLRAQVTASTGQPRRKASIARAAFLAAKSLKCETP